MAGDIGAFLEPGGGACGERSADDAMAGGFPGLAGDLKRGGFAGAGDTDDDVDAGARGW